MKFNGKEYKNFVSAFDESNLFTHFAPRKTPNFMPRGKSKVKTLDEVIEMLEDGDVISYPHYYRTGDRGLEAVVKKLREHGKRNIVLYGNAIFDHTDPWLYEAFKDGIITGVYGNIYRAMGNHLVAGDLLPWVGVGLSHGNRVRKLQVGEVHVKLAFLPVPMADIHGNANGVMGNPDEYCGPLGLATADAEYADYTCLLAGTVSEETLIPAEITMELTDFVVPMEKPGLSEGIGSGTLDFEKIRSNKFNAQIAENVTNIMKAAGVMKDGFAFQVGSGAGLIVLDNIRQYLKENNITANFAIGGITSMHVEMLEEGTLRHIFHGQLFEPSEKVIKSLLMNPFHIPISTGFYASIANKECAVNMLDVAVLSALEVDRDFNVNTVCASGRIIGGIGGGQDVAAGADLTIMFVPLATGKDGKGFPKIVEKVYTRTTPGEVIDVVVTEDFVCVNPKSKSSYKEAILENGKKYGLNIISMDELLAKSKEKAESFGVIPKPKPTTDEVVHVIEWRDGTLLDTIKKAMPK